jgi:L-alanine-DL-glutamate epimerase-like enolase superfamily enzyme
VKCAIIGRNPVIRIITDQGISGYAQAESGKTNVKLIVPYYKPFLVGADARDVGQIMLKIRRMGAMKPWGSAVSSIEIALWDVAGQAAGLPVYELLGGKIHDRVCAYGNSENNSPVFSPRSPQESAEMAAKTKEAKEGFKLVKMPVGFHSGPMMNAMPNEWYGQHWTGRVFPYMDRGVMTTRGFDYVLSCVEAIKKVLGNEIDLACDCGPGWVPKDAIRFARAVEP